jgi:hypothetical protein
MGNFISDSTSKTTEFFGLDTGSRQAGEEVKSRAKKAKNLWFGKGKIEPYQAVARQLLQAYQSEIGSLYASGKGDVSRAALTANANIQGQANKAGAGSDLAARGISSSRSKRAVSRGAQKEADIGTTNVDAALSDLRSNVQLRHAASLGNYYTQGLQATQMPYSTYQNLRNNLPIVQQPGALSGLIGNAAGIIGYFLGGGGGGTAASGSTVSGGGGGGSGSSGGGSHGP